MPVTLTTAVGDDIIDAVSHASPACVEEIDQLELVEAANWSHESAQILWSDGETPPDYVSFAGCSATARLTTKRDGALIVNLVTTVTTRGTVIARLGHAESTALAAATRARRPAWFECDLTLPDGRHVWLWRGIVMIDQKGLR